MANLWNWRCFKDLAGRANGSSEIISGYVSLGPAVEIALQPTHWRKPTQNLAVMLRRGGHAALISDLTLEEISRAPGKISANIFGLLARWQVERIHPSIESMELARSYIKARISPPRFIDDATHIALATLSRADALVSWNSRHMVNLARTRKVHSVNIALG